jgi:hypothetical protein
MARILAEKSESSLSPSQFILQVYDVLATHTLGLNPKPRHFKPFEYFDHTTVRAASK